MAVEAATAAESPESSERSLALSARQKAAVLRTAGELIRATASGEEPRLEDSLLEGAAEQAVAGVFVSLKRGKHLRSCCGSLTEKATNLGKTLFEASVRTACDDVRFPPVSVTELEHLNMEVWLLFNPQAIQARGEERAGAVIVGGKHGLVVSRGESRGLLLPGVAAENNWDARHFLEQVCLKAGLHSSLWKDDATELLTFEGEPLRGRLIDQLPPGLKPETRPHVERDSLTALKEFCRTNLLLLLEGRTPNYYLPGAADGMVACVGVAFRWPERMHGLRLLHYSLRPGLPLQASLFSLCQSAAQAIFQLDAQEQPREGLEVELAVLHDPSLHGNLRDSDLAGIEPSRRAVLVLERGRAGLAYDIHSSAESLLSRATKEAQAHPSVGASVFSLEAVTTEESFAFSAGPRPVLGPRIRPAAVAGSFYPAEAGALDPLIDQLLAGPGQPDSWAAAMVPHAGLRFSGALAAQVLKRLRIPDTVIVLGPKHTPLGVDWAVAPHETWTLPGLAVPSDPELARRLADAILGLELDSLAHQREHAIEVELPFIARLAPKARVVGIAIGHGDMPTCRQFAKGLAAVLSERTDHPLLLISSDMNHFATDFETRQLDELAVSALEGMDPEDVYKTVTNNGITMCGLLPAVIVLETLRLLGGGEEAERVGYATSADVTGDTSRVVGYAGMLFR